VKVEVREPTPEEDEKATDSLDDSNTEDAYSVEVRYVVTEALGYEPDDDRIDEAVNEYEEQFTEQLQARLEEAEEAYRAASNPGEELGEEIDNLRIVLAVREADEIGEENLGGNQIFVIKPYKWNGQWVFDYPSRSLDKEPFVAGVPEMLEAATALVGIENPENEFILLFSSGEFPDTRIRLDWVRKELDGNVYAWNGMEGWLCPALERFYPDPPKHLYVQVKPLQ